MGDFPAAHSMDTEWFAVDEHGRVGRFESGEDGAVPLDAATGRGPSDGTLDVDAIAVTRLAQLLANGNDPVASWDPPPARSAGRTVVVMDRAPSYRAAPDADGNARDPFEGELVRVGRRLPMVFLSAGDLSLERVEDLAARPGVRWVLAASDVHEALDDGGAEDGLFQFHHEHGEDPGLYARGAKPDKPLLLEDFPEVEREKIAALRLSVDFAEQEVHLADLIDQSRAATWGDMPLRYTPEWQAEQEKRQHDEERRSKVATRRGVLVLVVAVVVTVLFVLTRAKGLR
jgi:hypothetical protein